MKFEPNWKEKSLEILEKNCWPPLDIAEGSYLVQTCNNLRKKPLEDFSIEDLRIMIGQNIGLDFLIPLAIDVLRNNILAEGDFYEGDLLQNVLTSEPGYWVIATENFKSMCQLFEQNIPKLKAWDYTGKFSKRWFDAYQQFKRIGEKA